MDLSIYQQLTIKVTNLSSQWNDAGHAIARNDFNCFLPLMNQLHAMKFIHERNYK